MSANTIKLTPAQAYTIFELATKPTFSSRIVVEQTWTESGGTHTYVSVGPERYQRTFRVSQRGNPVMVDG